MLIRVRNNTFNLTSEQKGVYLYISSSEGEKPLLEGLLVLLLERQLVSPPHSGYTQMLNKRTRRSLYYFYMYHVFECAMEKGNSLFSSS